ncbi:hypothetical protein AYX14_02253 [Cryptococcus neoformans]|nr:hypothetical protein AYX14_02253 [Cryptococcus neoformans var. grubii]
MSSPRRRRNQQSTTVQSIRSHTPLTPRLLDLNTNIPTTRSRARLLSSKNHLKLNDENSRGPAPGFNKSLRSRGPLKENPLKMNVLEDKKVIIGKRKMEDEDENQRKGKMLKADVRRMGPPLKTVGSNNCLHTRHTLAPIVSLQRVPEQTQTVAPPTPAREILRMGMLEAKQGDDEANEAESNIFTVVARSPTPPRMRERPLEIKRDEDTTIGNSPKFIARPPTPPRPHQTAAIAKSPTPRSNDASLSLASPRRPLMHSSILSTPGRSRPSLINTFKSSPAHPLSTFLSTPRASQNQSTAAITTDSVSTTPDGIPPTVSVFTPNNRPKIASPLTNRRIALAVRVAKEQASLDALVLKATPVKQEIQPRAVEAPKENVTAEKVEEAAETTENVDIDMAVAEETTSTESVLGVDMTTGMRKAGGACEARHVPSVTEIEPNTKINVDEPALEAKSEAQPASDIISTSSAEIISTTPDPAQMADPAAPECPITQPAVNIQLHKTSSGRSLLGMGAPSRIPISTRHVPAVAAIDRSHLPSSTTRKMASGLGLGSLPERRPGGRPEMMGSEGSSTRGPPSSPAKRQPSYPSSLGSGPLARPTARVVSNPIRSSATVSESFSAVEMSQPPIIESSRSVSDPVPIPEPARTSRLSLSTNRREGMSLETSRSLAGLSEALEKLKSKKRLSGASASAEPPRKPTIPSVTVTGPAPNVSKKETNNLSASTSSTTMAPLANHRVRSAVHPADSSISSDTTGEKSILEMLSSSKGVRCFQGVVAFVDVRTSEGSDSSQFFSDILKSGGAKVLTRPTLSCTHVVYKSGRPATLNWYRRQDKPPKLVSIKWVTDSKKASKKMEEDKYLVDPNEEPIFEKRRKSMEPKALSVHRSTASSSAKRQALLAVAEAKNKSMSYAPKLPSPLKKTYINLPFSDDNK